MEVKARIKNLRISPRKVRLVADLVRGKKASDALAQLRFTNKKSAKPVSDIIQSGIANAEHNFKLDPENLYIKEIRVDKGLTLKRYQPRAFGRATMIQKKMSHINLVLAEINPTSEKKATEKKDTTAKKESDTKTEETKKTATKKAAPAKKATATTAKASKATASKVAKTNSTGKKTASRQANTKTASAKSTGKK